MSHLCDLEFKMPVLMCTATEVQLLETISLDASVDDLIP